MGFVIGDVALQNPKGVSAVAFFMLEGDAWGQWPLPAHPLRVGPAGFAGYARHGPARMHSRPQTGYGMAEFAQRCKRIFSYGARCFLHDGSRAAIDVEAATPVGCRPMAIRFQCGSCDQPIEVDDQWASKTVACPYCRNTITAPAASTLTDLSDIPVASPLEVEPQDMAPTDDAPPPGPFRSGHPNRIALVALGLAGVLMAFMVFASALVSSHRLEIESLRDRVEELQKNGVAPWAAAQRASSELYEDYGGMPPTWMIGLSVLYLGAGMVWVATLVCGLVGLRRANRRGMAIAALVVVGLTPVLLCCGGLMVSPQAG